MRSAKHNRRRSGVTRAIVFTLLIAGCNTTSSPPLAFGKPSLKADTYDADLVSCNGYVTQRYAGDDEKTGAVIMSLLLGGIVGGVAANSAYDQSKQRIFEECMYGKGYQMIVVPAGFYSVDTNPNQTDPNQTAPHRTEPSPQEISSKLIQENKLGELVDWQEATGIGTKESITAYVLRYPQGHFSVEAKKMLLALK